MKYTNTFKWLCAMLNLFRRHIGVKKKKKENSTILNKLELFKWKCTITATGMASN